MKKEKKKKMEEKGMEEEREGRGAGKRSVDCLVERSQWSSASVSVMHDCTGHSLVISLHFNIHDSEREREGDRGKKYTHGHRDTYRRGHT